MHRETIKRDQPRRSRWRAVLQLLGVLAVVGGLAWGGIRLFAPGPATTVVQHMLPCPYSENIKAFGDSVLYYDGMNIHCMSVSGTVRWSFPIGGNAGFDCNNKIVTAWAGSTIYILDQNGKSSYNDNLGETIQFARAGNQYVAAVIGDTIKPRLVVKDHMGAHMDEEADAYTDLILLDVGFYGKNGEYMWTLALDVFGTAANSILNTFEVGKMNTGEVSLGESIVYEVVYENSNLRVVGTRNMRTFDYRGTEDITQSVLVYGWRLIDHEVMERGAAQMLLAPTSQTENQFDIRELRMVSGNIDRRYSLPGSCVGGVVWQRALYAIGANRLYRAGMNDSRFAEYEVSLPGEITRLIDVTANGWMIVACGEEVYTLSMPVAR